MIRKKSKKTIEKRLAIKIIFCTIYLAVITVLFVCSYKVFRQKQNILPWDQVTSVEEYTYIEISEMSEKFAYFSDSKKQIHFVIEKEDTGLWHTYLVAIDENDYNKYKDIIDYTYQRTDKTPDKVKVYGYPVIVNDELKKLAIENIPNFVPAENEVVITADNFNEYLTNSYLDTTIKRKDNFNVILFILLFLIFIMIVLFISTIFSKKDTVEDMKDLVKVIKKKKKHLYK